MGIQADAGNRVQMEVTGFDESLGNQKVVTRITNLTSSWAKSQENEQEDDQRVAVFPMGPPFVSPEIRWFSAFGHRGQEASTGSSRTNLMGSSVQARRGANRPLMDSSSVHFRSPVSEATLATTVERSGRKQGRFDLSSR